MIRIKKPRRSPAILQTRGRQASSRLRKMYDAAPDDYRSGARRFATRDFDRDIYGADEVKQALRKAQHDKCAFCESKVAHISHGDIEHFRPKAGYRQRPDGPLVRPGYYWLAYNWSNLFLCCTLCNQKFKSNHFPLADPSQRASSHHDDIRREQPMLLHPQADDPMEFLEFDREYLRPVDDHPRGRATIDLLGLNRPEMVERRRDALASIDCLLECRDLLAAQTKALPDPEGVKRLAAIEKQIRWYLSDAQSDSAEYAAMIRAALRVWTG